MAAPAFLGRRRAARLLPERAFRPGLAQPESIVYATGVSGYGELLAARRAPPSWWRSIEDRLADITSQMRAPEKRNSQALLAELTELAAELEADAAASFYRFGASRAYDDRTHVHDQAPCLMCCEWPFCASKRT
jgi:Protein of unknown function (DUF3422)